MKNATSQLQDPLQAALEFGCAPVPLPDPMLFRPTPIPKSQNVKAKVGAYIHNILTHPSRKPNYSSSRNDPTNDIDDNKSWT
jgi:hypothetical protein